MLVYPIGGRAYLDRMSYSGYHPQFGTGYYQWSTNLGPVTSRPRLGKTSSGLFVPVPCDLHGLQFWCYQSSSDVSLKWKFEVWVQRKADDSDSGRNFLCAASEVFNFQDTENHLIRVSLIDADIELIPGDIVFPIFGRVDGDGDSRYYLYVNSGALTLRDNS